MRDPLTWSLPMGRLFGITIRVHLLFPVVALGLILRAACQKDAPTGLWLDALVLMILLFLSGLLHEFGHCFGARQVDGDAHEILLWPLGGLAGIEVPHTPRANFLATAAGPAVNLILCLLACAVLATQSMLPSFKPWSDPYAPVLYSWADNVNLGHKPGHPGLLRFTGSQDANKTWIPAAENATVPVHPDDVAESPEGQFVILADKDNKHSGVKVNAEVVPYGPALVLLSRVFWVNWFLLLLNLLPAFPLDGGRLLQAILWARSDYRQAMLWAICLGFLMMFVFLILAIVTVEPLVVVLCIVVYVACRRQWIVLETGGEESLFGYDFSQGYTSLERDQPPAPPRRRQNWFQRWRARREERRSRREQEKREAEERRMDELLEKVQRLGLAALTDEERRFLTRVSARYRHRQE